MFYWVKCENHDEAKDLLGIGTPSLPFCPDWSEYSLERYSFPIYADVKYHDELGFLLNDIVEDEPYCPEKYYKLITFEDFMKLKSDISANV